MFRKLLLYYHTIRYLKLTQIKYRVWYSIKNRLFKRRFDQSTSAVKQKNKLKFDVILDHGNSYQPPTTFSFLNQKKAFESQIDWNFSGYGKLWTYNLGYFDYLLQTDITADKGVALIRTFCNQFNECRDILEPYPTSLRIINLVKFLSKYKIDEPVFDSLLANECAWLRNNLEYHLMGNHLLENAFALLFGGAYLNDASLIAKGESILTAQLSEQILDDGGHFERSPMYHQIILHRMLDTYQLINNQRDLFSDSFIKLIQVKCGSMIGWLENMTFSNGTVPHFNDSTDNIASSPEKLFHYAEQLGIQTKKISLSDSGYRRYVNDHYELIADVGPIGPDYIPGHAHCDSLSFVINHHAKPLVVDTGISTYENSAQRKIERSTSAHNTVVVNQKEQSQVWASFRVGKRARTFIKEDKQLKIVAYHNGYKAYNVMHQRSFHFEPEALSIIDHIDHASGVFRLHFHPDVLIEKHDHTIQGDFGKIAFENADIVDLESYQYCKGFNLRKEAISAAVMFRKSMKTTFLFSE